MSILRQLARIGTRPESDGPRRQTPERHDAPDIPAVLLEIVALSGSKRFAQMHDVASRALEMAPGHPDLLFAKAGALIETGRFTEARAIYQSLVHAGLGSTPALVQLAAACNGQGDTATAEAILRDAASKDRSAFAPRYALSALLQGRERFAEAIPEIEAAIAADPQHADARIAYGNVLMGLGRFRDAEASYRRAIDLAPQMVAAWNNAGFALVRQDRHEESLDAFKHAFELEMLHGGDADAFANYAGALGDSGSDAAAIEVSERSLPKRPVPKAHYNYAISLLRRGRFPEGWCQYESRRLFEPSLRHEFGVPAWSGQSLEGKTLLLNAEQGLGDTIQMLRYVPALAARGARVLLRAPSALARLGAVTEGMSEVLEQASVIPQVDYYIHAMSLPGAFGTTLDTIPNDVPYLAVEPERRARWAARLGVRKQPRVGLVWAGSPTHVKDLYRSIALEALAPLLSVKGVEFVSLQKGPNTDDVARLPSRLTVTALGSELDDLADTAAVIEQLDLVVGVDTAVLHLAGALARPAWMMLPLPCDWRWLEGRNDNPWYPTLRLYRQSVRNRWSDVIEGVARDLANWAPGAAASPPPAAVAPVQSASVARLRDAKPAAPRKVTVAGITTVTDTRWGIVQYPEDGSDLATSLALLGEWHEPQIRLLCKTLKRDALVLEVGAGIGYHALSFATVLTEGRVYAFESASPARRLLRQNADANGLRNVVITSTDPARVPADPAESIDALRLERLDLLKVSRPDLVAPVLDGVTETLWRARPTLSLSTDDAVPPIVERLREFGYRCWEMRVPLFTPDNFNRRDVDPFGGRVARAILAFPEEVDVRIELPHCTSLD